MTISLPAVDVFHSDPWRPPFPGPCSPCDLLSRQRYDTLSTSFGPTKQALSAVARRWLATLEAASSSSFPAILFRLAWVSDYPGDCSNCRGNVLELGLRGVYAVQLLPLPPLPLPAATLQDRSTEAVTTYAAGPKLTPCSEPARFGRLECTAGERRVRRKSPTMAGDTAFRTHTGVVDGNRRGSSLLSVSSARGTQRRQPSVIRSLALESIRKDEMLTIGFRHNDNVLRAVPPLAGSSHVRVWARQHPAVQSLRGLGCAVAQDTRSRVARTRHQRRRAWRQRDGRARIGPWKSAMA
mgnify:CR=1 FL=1